MSPRVTLRQNYTANLGIRSNLSVSINAQGAMVLDGHDLGLPADVADGLGSDDDYEYSKTFAPDTLPAVREALGIAPDADLLAELAANWSGARSFELERLLSQAEIPYAFWSW